jgi:subtilisin family serine protease
VSKKIAPAEDARDTHGWKKQIGPECTVFHQLKIAKANLTGKAHERLLQDPNVRVFLNETRTIGPARARREQPDVIIQDSGSGRIIRDSGPGRIIRDSGPGRIIRDSGPGRIIRDSACVDLASYLEGVRDATDLTLVRLKGAPRETRARYVAETVLGWHWHLSSIGLTPGYRFTGKGVGVAVLDTGLDRTHPDFTGRVPEARCYDFLRHTTAMNDRHGHGTHCAGLIAARADSSQGRYSTAPDAELWVGKVMKDDGTGYDSDILEGIAWAVFNEVPIISLSLGSERDVGGDIATAYEDLARDLYLTHNCLLVAAAGNGSNRKQDYVASVENPAACDSFMAIAAIDQNDEVANFSCGQRDSIAIVNLSAPGVDVFSAWSGFSKDKNESRYERLSGTSMATPIVAAVAALHLEARPELNTKDPRNKARLWDVLEQTARSLGSPADFGRGCVRVP